MMQLRKETPEERAEFNEAVKLFDTDPEAAFAKQQELRRKRMMKASDSGPKHYTAGGVQPWDAMQEWMSPEEFKGYLRGNVIKYLARCRAKHPDPIYDLRKARHYLDKLIELESHD